MKQADRLLSNEGIDVGTFFGSGWGCRRVSSPQRRDRMLLPSALAIGLPALLGAAGESLGYDRWLRANTVKYRTHSLFRQGPMLYEHIPNWPVIACVR